MVAAMGCGSLLVCIFGVYSTLLNMAAPIVGGALILDILASIFPKLRIWASGFSKSRNRCYFNVLNERSLFLASSLWDGAGKKKPILIFADVNDDVPLELRTAAKRLGALCSQEELVDLQKSKNGNRQYFLIHEEEEQNLHDLVGITNKKNFHYLADAQIHLFTTGDAYLQLESQLINNMSEWGLAPGRQPVITPVRTAFNLATNLLVKVPLYEPLLHVKRKPGEAQQLDLLILGCGTYGINLLLAAYSMGQMLDTTLSVTVVSRESEEEFRDKLDSISPELLRSMDPEDDILIRNGAGDRNAPYCSLRYVSCDVQSSRFVELLQSQKEGESLLNTHYCMVALGNDSANLSAVYMLNSYLGDWHLTHAQARTVIAAVIHDPDMDRAMREYEAKNNLPSIYLHIVGSRDEMYSASNVFMSQYADDAARARATYSSINREVMLQDQKKRRKDAYSQQADLARGMHLKYRMFSIRHLVDTPLLQRSVFTTDGITDPAYIHDLQSSMDAYYQILTQREFADEQKREERIRMFHRMAWLEHRRWNANLRAMGFRFPVEHEKFIENTKKQKDVKRKLHTCLLECDDAGIRGAEGFQCMEGNFEIGRYVDQTGDTWTCTLEAEIREGFDKLDQLSYFVFCTCKGGYDFKVYDYPFGDVPKVSADAKPQAPKGYTPKPLETAAVSLSPELRGLTEKLAKNVHENWSVGRIADGWTYGKRRSDRKKTTPCLVPYEELPESEKAYDRVTAMETVKTILALGYTIQKEDAE